MDGRTDNVKTVYPLQTKFAGGIKKDGSALIRLNSVYSRKSTVSKGCWVAWGFFFRGFFFQILIEHTVS